MGLTQGNRCSRRVVKRILFQALEKVFQPLDADDTKFRQEPVSVKKLWKGDAYWSTSKIILSWLLDTITKTIFLPKHRATWLMESMDLVPPTQRYIAAKAWHKILGKLSSMLMAIPGCAGLFLVLWEAFRHKEHDRSRLRLSKTLHVFLKDFCWLAWDLASRPMSIEELILDRLPHTEGACDAAGTGMEGGTSPPSLMVPKCLFSGVHLSCSGSRID